MAHQTVQSKRPKFSQQVSKELEVVRFIWVLSRITHLFRLLLYSSIKYAISLAKGSKKLSSVSLSLLNFGAWQRESTQGHLSASSIPGAQQQEASWEQITRWPDFSHSLARATEWEWGQMHIADKSLQQIPILSLWGGRRKSQGNCNSQPPREIAPSRQDRQRAQRRACKVPGLLRLGLLLLIGLQNPILYLNAILFHIKLSNSSTLKLGQPAQRKLWTLNVACAKLCQKKRNWKLPIYIGNGRSKNILKNYILEQNQKFWNYKN